MRGCILATALFLSANAQIAPQWGSITCDSSVSGRFPPGEKYTTYTRYYSLTTDFPTVIPRNVTISTCTPKTDHGGTIGVLLETHGSAILRPERSPYVYSNPGEDEVSVEYVDMLRVCKDDELGMVYTFKNIHETDITHRVGGSVELQWEIGIYNPNIANDAKGGRYTISVSCPEAEEDIPPNTDLANDNVTVEFPYRQDWIDGGSKEISCGVSAVTTILNGSVADYFQFEVTEYAQQIAFTTCAPGLAYFWDTFNFETAPQYSSDATLVNYQIRQYFWNYDQRHSVGWKSDSRSEGGSNCLTFNIGDAYNPYSGNNILQLSPGIYYVSVERRDSGDDNGPDMDSALSMLCWNNAAVTAADDTKYDVPVTTTTTMYPTPPPVTTASPTQHPGTTTLEPTMTPSQDFAGAWNNTKKTDEMGQISCGIHQHDVLQKKHSNYYTFEVTQTTDVWFDTCMNDITNFVSCTNIWQYVQEDGEFIQVGSANCDYCNVRYHQNLSPNKYYYVEIYGESFKTDYGDYILRMGCGYEQEGGVTAVTVTDAPTPAPTGVADIPARDGRVVGDISCGITVQGETSAMRGDFHKFTVIKGGIDWLKFSTCDETSYENYLFVYHHVNISGLESWFYGDYYNSVGFHYEADTTCNELTMHDLVPGVYYVNIDGYNYFFDYGEYTIAMTCSDNGAVKSASNFEEYSPGLAWWAILLIVLAVLLCCGGIIFGVCYYKKKQESDSGHDAVQMGQTDTTTHDDGGE